MVLGVEVDPKCVHLSNGGPDPHEQPQPLFTRENPLHPPK